MEPEMTTNKTSKNPEPGARQATVSPDLLRTAQEIHTLAQMVRGQIAGVYPWVAPMFAPTSFEPTTAWMPSMATGAAPAWGIPRPGDPRAIFPSETTGYEQKGTAMFFNDPTLYGATLPQRDLPINGPFMSPYFAQWQAAPWQMMPWQTYQPWQGYQRYVPSALQHLIAPYIQQALPSYYPPAVPFTQGHGYGQPFVAGPFATAFNPYGQSFCNTPFYGWQKPLSY
jgi:hypothetical protein